MQIRETLENKGYTTILVDNGDSIQGEAIGTMSKGEMIIEIMNTMNYDIAIPGNHEFGGFLQVSGLCYTIDPSIPSPCKADENNMFSSIEGPRRVSDVTIGGVALDPNKTYTIAGTDYTLLSNGDGTTAFNGCKVLQDRVRLDNQLLIDFIADTLGGKVGTEYADPYGDGRITIKQ